MQTVKEKQRARQSDIPHQISHIYPFTQDSNPDSILHKTSSYQSDFSSKKNHGPMDYGELGIIEELEEGGDRRYTYDQGTVKNKFRN